MSAISTIQKQIKTDTQGTFLPEDEISIKIQPADVPVLNGKDSYFHFTFQFKNGDFYANLDPNGGGATSIFERVMIYNGSEDTLLETIEEPMIWTGIKDYYEKTEGLENVRSLLEGSQKDNVFNSIYFKPPATGHASVDYTSVEICLPLYQSGVLYPENGKVFPVAATEGLVLKLQLCSAMKCAKGIVMNGMVQQRDRQGLDPVVADLKYTVGAVTAAPAGPVAEDNPETFEVATDIAAGALAFIEIQATGGAVGAPNVAIANLKINVLATDVGGEDPVPMIVGNTLYYVCDAGTIVNAGKITAIGAVGAPTANKIRITLDGTYTVVAGTVATAANHPPCFGCLVNQRNSLSYEVRDFELVASTVNAEGGYLKSMMRAMGQKGGLEIDIKSFNLYRNNLYKGVTKTQELIPTTEYRACAVLQAQINPVLSWATSYAQPLSDYLNNYSYVLANKNVPNRAVQVEKEQMDNNTNRAWNAIADGERHKTLERSKVRVLDELHPSKCMCFGRALSSDGYSYNANKNEMRLNQTWGILTEIGVGSNIKRLVGPQYDKLLYSYIPHYRKLMMKPNNVEVVY